jgi:hypothetical protein
MATKTDVQEQIGKMAAETLSRDFDCAVLESFPGKTNAGLRAKIHRAVVASAERLAKSLDDLDPSGDPAEAVRGVGRSVALTGLGRAKMESLAKMLEG